MEWYIWVVTDFAGGTFHYYNSRSEARKKVSELKRFGKHRATLGRLAVRKVSLYPQDGK